MTRDLKDALEVLGIFVAIVGATTNTDRKPKIRNVNDKRSKGRTGGTGHLRRDTHRDRDRGADADIAKMLTQVYEENQRLRSALELIACGGDPNFEHDPAFDYGTNVAMHLQQIAREAMKDVGGPNGEVCDAGADEVVRWALKIRKVGRKWVVYRYDPDGWLQHKVGWFESREDAQRCIDNHRERR